MRLSLGLGLTQRANSFQYPVFGSSPAYVLDAVRGVYRLNGVARTLDQLVPVTRAGSATYVEGGVLKTAVANVTRRTQLADGSHAVLLEPAGTNHVRNNTMAGAVVGTPGTNPTNWGVSTGFASISEVVAVGSEDGIDYVRYRFSGTPSGIGLLFFETATGIAAANGEEWTSSFYLRIVDGDFTNLTSLRARFDQRSASAFLSEKVGGDVKDLVTSEFNRVILTATTDEATIANVRPCLEMDWDGSGVVDFTIDIGVPQMEKYHVATSVIKTSGAATARIADTVTGLATGLNPAAGMGVVSEAAVDIRTTGSVTPRIWQMDNGANGLDRFLEFINEGTGNRAVAVGKDGPLTLSAVVRTPSTGDMRKVAAYVAPNDLAAIAAGGTVATDTSGAMDAGMSTLWISTGAGLGATPYPTTVKQLRLYPTPDRAEWTNTALGTIANGGL